ncbi:MAG: hypothetical protein KGY56_09890 [Desulfobacterales bacterium]|nr:hypothetical protein [Desulfobacterales bacterium]
MHLHKPPRRPALPQPLDSFNHLVLKGFKIQGLQGQTIRIGKPESSRAKITGGQMPAGCNASLTYPAKISKKNGFIVYHFTFRARTTKTA